MEVSLETFVQINRNLHFSLAFGYLLVNYYAEADWNLIDVFEHSLSFSHTSKESGLGINVIIEGCMNKIFSITVNGLLNTITIRKGKDTSYLTTENEILTQFNGAENSIYGLRIGLCISI